MSAETIPRPASRGSCTGDHGLSHFFPMVDGAPAERALCGFPLSQIADAADHLCIVCDAERERLGWPVVG